MSEAREGTERVSRGHPERDAGEFADQDERGRRGEHGPRGRRERMRRDRRRQGAVIAVAALTGLIAGALGSPRDHTARALSPPTSTTLAPAPVPARTLLIGHLDPTHRLDLLAVAGIDRGGRVGSVVFVPTSTLVEVPSFDTQALIDVPRLGSSTLLETTVANALGLNFTNMILVNDTQLAELLAPADHLNVTFVNSVQINDAAGTLAFSSGQATISAADATRLLIGPATGGELEHLVAVQAVLEAWFARLRSASVAVATERVTGSAHALVALAGTDVSFDTIPVDELSSGSVTRYELQEPAANTLVRADLPDGIITTGRRPRVEVLNGTGAIALTQAVARRIVPAGGEITLTGNVPGFGVHHTSVVYYQPAELTAARRLAAALGVGSVAEGNIPIDVVDLTVVVGADFHPNRP
jgi:hypothetical protein